MDVKNVFLNVDLQEEVYMQPSVGIKDGITTYVAVLQILWYIKDTLFHGLYYSSQSSFKLHAYSDANLVGDPTDQCSITCFCFLLGTSLVSWRSKKQDAVSHSSIEVKYMPLMPPWLSSKSSFGGSWLTWMLHSPLPLLFIITIVVLSTLLIMMSSMKASSTLRSIATSFANISRKAISSCSPSPLLTSLLIFSRRLTRLVVFEILHPNSSWLPPCYLKFEGRC